MQDVSWLFPQMRLPASPENRFRPWLIGNDHAVCGFEVRMRGLRQPDLAAGRTGQISPASRPGQRNGRRASVPPGLQHPLLPAEERCDHLRSVPIAHCEEKRWPSRNIPGGLKPAHLLFGPPLNTLAIELTNVKARYMARSTLDRAESSGERLDLQTLDDRIASLLTAIEGEAVPERLLKLANELQGELLLRRQRKQPN